MIFHICIICNEECDKQAKNHFNISVFDTNKEWTVI